MKISTLAFLVAFLSALGLVVAAFVHSIVAGLIGLTFLAIFTAIIASVQEEM